MLTAVLLVGLPAAGIWSLVDLRVNVATLIDGYANGVRFVQRIWPLEPPPLDEVLRHVGLTLSAVVLATVLSVCLSIPLAFWAASNTKRGEGSRLAARSVIVAARAVPDLVMAIVFVRLFGLGVLPGVLAMGLHSIGMVGKLYADAVEQIDEGPREALRAAGAGRAQQLLAGVLPQVLPAFVAVALHRLDINIRVSAILGYVGVLGVGMEMSHAFARLDFGLGISWALILVVLCVVVELLSTALRRALLGDSAEFDRHNRHTLVSVVRRRVARAEPDRPRATAARGSAAPVRVTPGWTARRLLRTAYWAVFAAGLVWAVQASGVLASGLSGGVGGAVRTVGLFWPPGAAGVLPQLVEAMVVTVQIALGATLIGAVLALPVGSMAARNVAPNRWVYLICRGFVLAVRGLPELVLAIVLVVIVGLGPVAGTLALGVGAIGLLGKLVADSLEEVDPGPRDALRASGASRLQTYFTAILPLSAPAIVGHVLYQLDVNVRAATLLGIVGGGGIGYMLLQATRTREYEVVTLIMLITFGVVLVVEGLAMLLRRLLR
ncbi:phosphonate transport system permease protein [Saccharothrix saharensis]|uniref:Phosphonate transport system permease protein n=1 Tax=Saccharothrix saharensis TaxID=571190 RepID=A0A543J9A2_9PSEU|nr:phosphonate ABC transporter, permease protein PhnE [Saccharothrix saharensis]TQM79388.1 phosphonate transport system permease protein [Saccharothrix saharensis]